MLKDRNKNTLPNKDVLSSCIVKTRKYTHIQKYRKIGKLRMNWPICMYLRFLKRNVEQKYFEKRLISGCGCVHPLMLDLPGCSYGLISHQILDIVGYQYRTLGALRHSRI